MGNVCGKYLCCVPVENNGKQYQPETKDGKVNIVTNQGSTVDTNSQPSTSNSSTAKNGEMNKIGNEEKKKKAKKKKNDSSSSDSDDSDDYIGKVPAFKGLNGRGPTIYNVRGSVKSYEHCNVNIGGTHTTIHKTQAPPAPVTTKTEKRTVFDSFYTGDSAIEEETRQWNSVKQAGCFYNTRDMGGKKYVNDLQATMDMQSSVGMIRFQGISGTCFRVGPKHIMLPLHIIQGFINNVFDRELGEVQKTYRDLFSPTTLNQPTETTQQYLQILNNEVYIVFSYLIEQQGGFNESDKFYLKEFSNGIADVPFFDAKTDSMVLELQEDSATRSDLPPAFTNFAIPKLDEGFTFISHSGGERKQIDDVKQFVNPEAPKIIEDMEYLRGESDRFLRSKNMDVAKYRFDNVGPSGFGRIQNPARYLFHTKCSKGGSGSPGVVVLPNNTVAVVTMLVCGYPDWRYEGECDQLSEWPLEFCVEQGSNMAAIRDEMIQQNKTQLANEIFPNILNMIH